MSGKGVLTEAAALIATVRTAEMAVEIYLSGPPVVGTRHHGREARLPAHVGR